RKAGYSDETLAETVKIPLASRRRVNLKTKDGKIGFYIENSHQLVDIEECKIIEPALFDLILALKPQVKKFPDINSIQINAIDGGYDVVLASKNRVNLSKFERLAGVKRLSSSVNGKISAVYQDGDAAITLAGLSIRIPQSAFLQASKEAAEAMSNLVLQAVGKTEKIADLFAGIGAYSFALAKQADVTAFEIDAAMVTTINNAAKIYKLNDKLKAEKRDLFKEPIGYYALKNYDAIVINPPRSGAKAQIEQIAIAKTPKVVMISCNHATFARDAKILKDAGYKLDRLTPIDQFVYTSPLELVGEFSI
ncbi:MAG: methyltransferase, partial [Pseudomonadota bacterium]